MEDVFTSVGGKKKTGKFSVIKIFIITLFISGAISLITEVSSENMSAIVAVIIVLVLIVVGIFFDIVGVAFASCDEKPFIAMSAKKMMHAQMALRLLKNADLVSNICNDVVGDICGIISGAAGVVIATMAFRGDLIGTVFVSAMIAALTVSGKYMGKRYAIRYNIRIVEMTGSFLSLFRRKK